MKTFEYKVVSIPTVVPIGSKGYEKVASELKAQLNELGADGWELIQREGGFFFFKRETVVE